MTYATARPMKPKRQRAAALQTLSAVRWAFDRAKRPGVRLLSALLSAKPVSLRAEGENLRNHGTKRVRTHLNHYNDSARNEQRSQPTNGSEPNRHPDWD